MAGSNQISRRDFIKLATVTVGTVIGVGLGVPMIDYLIDPALKAVRQHPGKHLGPFGDTDLLQHAQSPQPGITEAAIGKKATDELAVMVDTFYPLSLTRQAVELEKAEYMDSWLEGDPE